MHEKLDLIKITLEIIQRVTGRVDALIFGIGGRSNTMFVRLLNLCSALDSWLDVNIPIEREIQHHAAKRQDLQSCCRISYVIWATLQLVEGLIRHHGKL